MVITLIDRRFVDPGPVQHIGMKSHSELAIFNGYFGIASDTICSENIATFANSVIFIPPSFFLIQVTSDGPVYSSGGLESPKTKILKACPLSAIRFVTSGTDTIQILHDRHEKNFAIALLNFASVWEKLIASYSIFGCVDISTQGITYTVRFSLGTCDSARKSVGIHVSKIL